jgi:acetyltransferase
MPIQNPLDIWPALMKHGLRRVYTRTLGKMIRDPAVDGVICIAIAPELPENAFLDVTEIIREQLSEMNEKPVAAWLYGPNQPEVSRRLDGTGLAAAFPSLPRAAKALAALYERHRYLAGSEK